MNTQPSLLDAVEVPQNEDQVPSEPTTVVTSKPKRTSKRTKPYEQLTQVGRIMAARKAEKKAIKTTGTKKVAKASKPGGKPSKAATKVASRKASVKKVLSGSNSGSAICSVCHKPLSKHSSVENGMGGTCASKMKLLPKGTTLEDHYETLTVFDVPTDHILLKDAIDGAKKKGYSGYAFLIACGGDRMLRPPVNEYFQVSIYKGKRYVPKSCLKHLDALKRS